MWFLTIHRWTGEPVSDPGLLGEHLLWNREHHRSGRILFSGPANGGNLGIIVFRGDDLSRATLEELCSTEPFLAAGAREMDIIPWEPRQVLGAGAFTLEELELAGGST